MSHQGYRKGNESPPDLEQLLKKLFRSSQRGKKAPKANMQMPSFDKKIVSFLSLGFLILFILSGIFIVEPPEKAIIIRFGKYARTEGPGPHWHIPLIERKRVINVDRVYTFETSDRMLTQDENIISLELAVQYFVQNPKDYLFNVVEPENSLRQATEAALRIVIGHSNLDQILTSGRAEISARITTLIDEIIADYHSGLALSDVTMQPARAPLEVKDAFDDVIKAQEDEIREVNRAETYARRITPIARGDAKRVLEEANAYRERVVLDAKGQTARFEKFLPEYKKAPETTRQRLYIDVMENILSSGNRIVADTSQAPFLYLPLDKLQAESKALPVSEESNTNLPKELSQLSMPLRVKQENTENTRSDGGRISRDQYRALRESGYE